MLPEKFVEDMENSQKRREILRHLKHGAAFIVVALIVGPLIHEIAHVVSLIIQGCSYSMELGASFSGLHGAVEPLCHLSDTGMLLFYLSGYGGTLVLATVLGIAAVEKDMLWTLTISSGLFMSAVVTVGAHGDLSQAARVAGGTQFHATLTAALLILGSLGSSLWTADKLFERLERKESG